MDSSTTQQKLASLEEAIAEGVLEVEFQGRKVKYRSLDEMQRIANSLRRDINNKHAGGIIKSVAVFEKY